MLLREIVEIISRLKSVVAVEDASRQLTYGQVLKLAVVMKRTISRLTDCDRIGIMLPASSMFPAVFLGVLWAKRKAVPLNFLLASDELATIVKDAELDVVMTVRHFSELISKLPVRAVYLEDLPLKRGMLWASITPRPALPDVSPDDTALILYTSGTTGQPKGVELTHRNLASNCKNTIAALDIDPQQRFLNVLPPFHIFGLTATVLVPMYMGACVYAVPRFSPAVVVRTVAKQRITILMAIPSMYAALLRTKSSTAATFESVRIVISGGEPLPDTVRKAFLDRYNLRLFEGYGLTETSPVVCICSDAHYRERTVGKVIPQTKIQIVKEDSQLCPACADGEIQVQGPGVMKGYYKRPEETDKVFTKDGWYLTGDIGQLDVDGFLSITGRVKDMIIVGGENVFPREIEDVLESHDSVLQAAVIGQPDDLRGEVAIAFVVLSPDKSVDEGALKIYARQKLAGFKVPRRIIISENLPTGPTGKVLKRKLASLL